MMFDQPPSNPIPGSSGAVERASSSRKRSMDDPLLERGKRPRYSWYVKLESENSSLASEEDTESVYSIQGYETERIQDTPDTDTKSESSSSSDVDFEVEYEIDDLSGEEENPLAEGGSSSGTDDVLAAAGAIAAVICDSPIEAWLTGGEDSDNSSAGDTELNHTDFWTCMQCKSPNNNPLFRFCQKCFQDVLAAAGAIAAVICDSPIEAWLTGGEDSDNSSAGDTELNHTDFWTCMQCKSPNNNPLFRFCQKCFQMRKNLFPPRPRGHRKRQTKAEKQSKEIEISVQQKPPEPSVDSGIGSQESVASSIDSQIGSGSQIPTYDLNIANTSSGIEIARGVKRKNSTVRSEHLGVNGDDSSKRCKTEEVANGRVMGDDENKQLRTHDSVVKTKETSKAATVSKQYPDYADKSLCIMCESASQNSVFVHAGMGCLCCCYKCAMRTWTTHKKCPACTRKAKNIIRINRS